MVLYRFVRRKYLFSPPYEGAEKVQTNRWNSKGTSIIYTAESRALALTEVLAGIQVNEFLNDYYLFPIHTHPDCSIIKISMQDLPINWQQDPPGSITQKMGDLFVQERDYLLCQVPSSIIPEEYNYLINPNHPDYDHKITIDPKYATPFLMPGKLLI